MEDIYELVFFSILVSSGVRVVPQLATRFFLEELMTILSAALRVIDAHKDKSELFHSTGKINSKIIAKLIYQHSNGHFQREVCGMSMQQILKILNDLFARNPLDDLKK